MSFTAWCRLQLAACVMLGVLPGANGLHFVDYQGAALISTQAPKPQFHFPQALPTGWRAACPCTMGTARWESRPPLRRWEHSMHALALPFHATHGGLGVVQLPSTCRGAGEWQDSCIRCAANCAHAPNTNPLPLLPLLRLCASQLHPSCARVAADDDGLLPEWMVYHELVSTGRVYLSKVRFCWAFWGLKQGSWVGRCT